jgi:hypothetical protein
LANAGKADHDQELVMDASPSSSHSPLVTELKTRARLRLNASRKGAIDDAAEDLRLRDCLNLVSREVGFAHWEHARRVLGGLAAEGDDMGSFWHAPRTTALLNEWFARHEQAEAALRRDEALFLLPYRRQFVVVEADFVHELGLDAADALWREIGHDLVRGYATPAWEALANQRLRAPRASFG